MGCGARSYLPSSLLRVLIHLPYPQLHGASMFDGEGWVLTGIQLVVDHFSSLYSTQRPAYGHAKPQRSLGTRVREGSGG